MPFSHVAPVFQPEQIAKLTAAFDQAWLQLSFAHRTNTPLELEWLRRRLANHLLLAQAEASSTHRN